MASAFSSSARPDTAALSPIHSLSLSSLFLDDLVFPDGSSRLHLLGGAGVYASVGSRLWLMREREEERDQAGGVGFMGKYGEEDGAEKWRQEMERMGIDTEGMERISNPTSSSTSSSSTEFHTPRAWNIFEFDGRRSFIFRTREDDYRKHFAVKAEDLDRMPARYREAKALHLCVSAARIENVVKGIEQNLKAFSSSSSSSFSSLSLPRGSLIYEPSPNSCIPSSLPVFSRLFPHFTIFSPNLVEACGLLAVDEREGNKDPVQLIQRLREELEGKGKGQTKSEGKDSARRARSLLVLRMGERGCLVSMIPSASSSSFPSSSSSEQLIFHVPAYPARVVDVTGAGNAFCAAFNTTWQLQLDHPELPMFSSFSSISSSSSSSVHSSSLAEVDRVLLSAAFGTVAASFVIEQYGLPPRLDEPLRREANRRVQRLLQHVREERRKIEEQGQRWLGTLLPELKEESVKEEQKEGTTAPGLAPTAPGDTPLVASAVPAQSAPVKLGFHLQYQAFDLCPSSSASAPSPPLPPATSVASCTDVPSDQATCLFRVEVKCRLRLGYRKSDVGSIHGALDTWIQNEPTFVGVRTAFQCSLHLQVHIIPMPFSSSTSSQPGEGLLIVLRGVTKRGSSISAARSRSLAPFPTSASSSSSSSSAAAASSVFHGSVSVDLDCSLAELTRFLLNQLEKRNESQQSQDHALSLVAMGLLPPPLPVAPAGSSSSNSSSSPSPAPAPSSSEPPPAVGLDLLDYALPILPQLSPPLRLVFQRLKKLITSIEHLSMDVRPTPIPLWTLEEGKAWNPIAASEVPAVSSGAGPGVAYELEVRGLEFLSLYALMTHYNPEKEEERKTQEAASQMQGEKSSKPKTKGKEKDKGKDKDRDRKAMQDSTSTSSAGAATMASSMGKGVPVPAPSLRALLVELGLYHSFPALLRAQQFIDALQHLTQLGQQ